MSSKRESMMRKARIFLTMIFFGLLSGSALSSDESIKDKPAPYAKLSISVEKNSAYVCSPLNISFSITNTSSEKILSCPSSHPMRDFEFILKNEKGDDVEKTRYGKKFSEKKGFKYANKLNALKPKDEHKGTLMISRMFDLSVSEKYSVQLRRTIYHNRTPIHLVSNEIVIEIKDYPQ